MDSSFPGITQSQTVPSEDTRGQEAQQANTPAAVPVSPNGQVQSMSKKQPPISMPPFPSSVPITQSSLPKAGTGQTQQPQPGDIVSPLPPLPKSPAANTQSSIQQATQALPQQQPPPLQPVSLPQGTKERGPMTVSTASGVEASSATEEASSSGQVAEVEAAGETEKPVSDQAQIAEKLSQEAKQAETGLDKHSVKELTGQKETVSLPMPYPDAKQKQRRSKIRDALKWLATMIIYQWRKIQPELKK